MDTEGIFSGGKATQEWCSPLTPSSAEVKNGGVVLLLPNMSSWYNA
jgi:hypothetical protein